MPSGNEPVGERLARLESRETDVRGRLDKNTEALEKLTGAVSSLQAALEHRENDRLEERREARALAERQLDTMQRVLTLEERLSGSLDAINQRVQQSQALIEEGRGKFGELERRVDGVEATSGQTAQLVSSVASLGAEMTAMHGALRELEIRAETAREADSKRVAKVSAGGGAAAGSAVIGTVEMLRVLLEWLRGVKW